MNANNNFDSEEHKYEIPQKKIIDIADMNAFQHSAQCVDLNMFTVECIKAVKGTKMTQTELNPRIQPLYDYLEKLEQWLNDVPPVEQPMRFGNKAFRTWLDKIIQNVDADLLIIGQAGNPEFQHF